MKEANANKREVLRLVKNVLAIVAIILVGVLLYRGIKSLFPEKKEWALEATPLRIVQIRKIAELSTVSYKDEIVVDSFERYKDKADYIQNLPQKVGSIKDLKTISSGDKRRLTMIIGGEVRFGFNLNDPNFNVKTEGDTIIVDAPKPQILDVIILPSETKIFQEIGSWSDYARKRLQRKAENELKSRAEMLNLDVQSKQQLENMLRKLVPNDKKILIRYL